jgi:hypothetical protein
MSGPVHSSSSIIPQTFANSGPVHSGHHPSRHFNSYLFAFLAEVGPVHSGFGSLIVDDREKVTQKILDAFQEAGQRLLLSKYPPPPTAAQPLPLSWNVRDSLNNGVSGHQIAAFTKGPSMGNQPTAQPSSGVMAYYPYGIPYLPGSRTGCLVNIRHHTVQHRLCAVLNSSGR